MSENKRRVSLSKTPGVSDIKNPEVAHETTDVNIGAVGKFIIWLVVVVSAVYILIYLLFNYFKYSQQKAEPPPASQLIRSPEQKQPPEPRLQLSPGHRTHPLEDMKELRQKEDERLNNYGWVDKDAGIVHIPIEQAKKLLLKRGLPVRQIKPQEESVQLPSSTSSGRAPYERRRQ
jgi:hypothetical protein